MKRLALIGKRGLGKFAIIDDDDFERCKKLRWSLNARNIPFTALRDTTVSLGRFVMFEPKGFEVDHKNRKSLDNRKCNLRICSSTLNKMNVALRNGKISKFKGVRVERDGKWEAKIKINKASFEIGRYDTEKDAARAYNAVCKLVYGEYGWLNTFS